MTSKSAHSPHFEELLRLDIASFNSLRQRANQTTTSVVVKMTRDGTTTEFTARLNGPGTIDLNTVTNCARVDDSVAASEAAPSPATQVTTEDNSGTEDLPPLEPEPRNANDNLPSMPSTPGSEVINETQDRGVSPMSPSHDRLPSFTQMSFRQEIETCNKPIQIQSLKKMRWILTRDPHWWAWSSAGRKDTTMGTQMMGHRQLSIVLDFTEDNCPLHKVSTLDYL
ncbi:hypothetical protein K474DRAFT_1674952 [Panus rudis PR-1116 ss-1]|nr:hypothetical protein K474DRAFT_1674952 [Panus rudis PR-1116 ss-1]